MNDINSIKILFNYKCTLNANEGQVCLNVNAAKFVTFNQAIAHIDHYNYFRNSSF